MSALRELQRDMASAIREAAATEHLTLRPLTTLPAPHRLVLHARNYRASLQGVLASAFPAVRRLVGEGFFAFTTARFASLHPPRNPVLALYGADFPGWLAAAPQLHDFPFVADTARLEWTIHALSDALPAPPCNLNELAGAADAYVTFAAGAVLFEAPAPVADLIEPDADPAQLDMTAPCYLLLAPTEQGVTRITLTADSFATLTALSNGQTLSQALADHAPADFIALLRRLAQRGVFSAITPVSGLTS